MMENYNHYIIKNIQSVYRTKMIPPTVYLVLLLALWIFSPISEMVLPKTVDSGDNLESLYEKDISFIETKLSKLYFSGYTKTRFGLTSGYYYYTKRGDECIIVLLSPSTSEEGLPTIPSLEIKGRLAKSDPAV
ncbi:MAG: hypothetical protein HFI37_05790, partial [Lachnospiraceae bacterium]|nr:hypothetical protein [Lachnospiraceae bacterium]